MTKAALVSSVLETPSTHESHMQDPQTFQLCVKVDVEAVSTP